MESFLSNTHHKMGCEQRREKGSEVHVTNWTKIVEDISLSNDDQTFTLLWTNGAELWVPPSPRLPHTAFVIQSKHLCLFI